MSQSVNQANINASKLKSYPIKVGAVAEQRCIVEAASSLNIERKRLTEQQNAKKELLQQLKQSILKKAFSGELTSNPDKVLNEVGV